jgi:hypothetical protein
MSRKTQFSPEGLDAYTIDGVFPSLALNLPNDREFEPRRCKLAYARQKTSNGSFHFPSAKLIVWIEFLQHLLSKFPF